MTPAEESQVAYRVGLLEGNIAKLESKVDRLTWALVTLSLSVAGSAIVFTLTVAGLQ
jgi:hypothetical protein